MQARQLLRSRRRRPVRRGVAVTDAPGHADECFARRFDAAPEEERTRHGDGAGRDQDHSERPEIVLGEEHRACARPRAHADADHGDDGHPGDLRAEAPSSEGVQHERARKGDDRSRSRREQGELDGLAHFTSSRIEPVADAPDGGDASGRRRVVFDLLPQASDVHRHG